MSIKLYDKSGGTPQEVLLAGTPTTDLILNGTSKNPIANKTVYNALATKIESTVENLVNFYNKSQVYNKQEVRNLIGAINTLTIEVVNELPTQDISATTIYFLKQSEANTYDEYIYVDNAWVKIGDTDIDLSGYLTTANFQIAIADYYTKSAIDAMIANYYTKTQVDAMVDAKQDELTFDNAPTAGSDNPVKSGGIKTALDAKQNSLTFDDAPTKDSSNVVKSGGVYSAIDGIYSVERLSLESIVAKDSTVVDMQTLVNYLLVNYGTKKSSYSQYYRIWVTALSSDERYTTCAQSLSDVYSELTGHSFNFAELLMQREAGNYLSCHLRPFINNYPNANIVYWNSNGSWAADRLMNQNSGWYLDGGLGVIDLDSNQDLNDIIKPSLYLQGSSSNATAAHHYPCGISGILEVQSVANNLIVQKYRPCSSIDYTTTFIRRQYGGAWSDWMSDDYVVLGSVTAQSITTSGITVNIPYSLALRCREFACQAYGLLLIQDYYYAASGYMSLSFIYSNNRYKLYWANNSATTATLYLDNSAGTTVAGNIPALTFLGKLGRNLPTVFH